MAAQDEREPGGLVMCSVLGPMVQDIPEQDIAKEEQFFPPQMDPEPEMGAAAAGAAVYDTSPPLPHQNPPPIPAETVRLSAPDMAQLVAILAGMESKMGSMNEKMEANTNGTKGIKEEMKEMRGVRELA